MILIHKKMFDMDFIPIEVKENMESRNSKQTIWKPSLSVIPLSDLEIVSLHKREEGIKQKDKEGREGENVLY